MKTKTPIVIKLSKEIWGETVTENLSPDVYLPLAFTETNNSCTNEATLIRQTISGKYWFMEGCDFHTTKSGVVLLKITESILLIIYSLKNTMQLLAADISWSWNANQYRMVFLSKGTYKLQLNKGHTACLFIQPPMHLLEVTKHPDIKNNTFGNSALSFMLREAPILRAVKMAFYRLRKIDPEKNQLTAKIFTVIIALLAIYDKTLLLPNTFNTVSYATTTAIAVRQYLSDNLYEPGVGNMQALCKQFYISPKTLRKSFITLTGLTVVQWVKDKRLEKAMELVTQTKESISSIAYGIGYSEPNNMLRDFIAKYGKSPTTVRNQKT